MKRNKDFEKTRGIIRKEKLDYLLDYVDGAEYSFSKELTGEMWQLARETPHELAHSQGEFVVQMIDEFQYLTSEICRDREAQIPVLRKRILFSEKSLITFLRISVLYLTPLSGLILLIRKTPE